MAVRHLFRVIIQDCSATKEEGWFYGATGIVGLGRHRSSVVIGRPLGRSMLYDILKVEVFEGRPQNLKKNQERH